MSEDIYSKELIDFRNTFSPDILKNLSGLELLKRLAYPKNTDENIKQQFNDLYEVNYNSLKNKLEKGMHNYGSGNAGFDINFVLAYRQGSWYNLKEKISLEQAVKIAENIKQELTKACEFLSNNDFNGFYNYVSQSTLNLFNKGYTHKYLHILYPNYISFYHAGNWQSYYKSCLNLPQTNNYYDLEKYLIDKFPGCNVGEKSKEFEKKYGIPNKKFWLLTWNPDKWEWKTFLEDIDAVCKGQNIESKYSCLSKKPKIGDRVYILKLGTKSPKGIIASGYISKESYPDIAEHTNDNKLVNCIKIKYDKIINFNNFEILKQETLKEKFPKQEWSPQASGIEIKKEYTKELENIWSNYSNNPQQEIKYWTYRAGENTKLWDECASGNIISIGWDYLGNLKQYLSKEEISEKISNEEHKKNPMNDALACWEFTNEMNINDIIYVEKGRDCLIARGIVESDYIYDNTRQKYRNIRKVHWTHKEEHKLDFQLDVKTLTDISPSKFGNYCKKIEDIFMNNKKNNTENIPLNQILYGPPGTGKTYNTVIKAIEITNPELMPKDKDGNVENYETLKNKFDELKQQGQIEFVTFHQSYSYEEFVEGIKPEIPKWNDEGSELKYVGKDGILKTIAKKALYEHLNILQLEDDKFKNIIKCFISDNPEGSKLKTQYSEFEIVKYTQTAVIVEPCNGKTEYNLTFNNLEKLYSNKQNIENRKDIDQILGWKGLSTYYLAVLNKLKDYSGKNITNNQISQNQDSIIIKSIDDYLQEYQEGKLSLKEDPKKYILIIDEINRGNISKIFGELITLIETDKRIGNKHEASTTLPYSKEQFGIPKNLYIIGTMNTSDRSIASIDIALRRRFKFVEMMPRPEKIVNKNNQPQMVEDINLQSLLKTINERISYLLDRDHQIGHSYFMNWKNYDMATLKDVWFDEIIPLLNEYFYSDWDKLQAILGGKNDNDKNDKKFFITKLKKPDLAYNVDCSDEEFYYNFVKKEDVNETDFRTMLENAKLIEPKPNETSNAN